MKPIYFRDVKDDGTLGYRVIWPGGFLSFARPVCFIEGSDCVAKKKAEAVVEWLSQEEGS